MRLHGFHLVRLTGFEMTVVAGAVTACIAVALALSAVLPKEYQATASMALEVPSFNDPLVGSVGSSTATPAEQAVTESSSLLRDSVLRTATGLLSPHPLLSDLRSSVTVRVQNVSNLILVQATAGTPTRAAAIANAVALAAGVSEAQRRRQQFTNFAQGVHDQLATSPGTPLARVETLARLAALSTVAKTSSPLPIQQAAIAPTAPTAPDALHDALIAAASGLLLGLVAVALRRALDDRLRAPDIEAIFGLPIVGGVPRLDRAGAHASASAGESVRILRKSLELLSERRQSVIVVTSPLPFAGHSAIGSALACVSAAAGTATIALDCDLRTPGPDAFGLPPGPGIVEVILNEATPGEVIRAFPADIVDSAIGPRAKLKAPLDAVGPGRRAGYVPELLSSPSFERLVDHARSVYELVIINAPPLLPVVDAMELTTHADIALICVPASGTTRLEARDTKRLVAELGACPACVVIVGGASAPRLRPITRPRARRSSRWAMQRHEGVS